MNKEKKDELLATLYSLRCLIAVKKRDKFSVDLMIRLVDKIGNEINKEE